MTLKEALDTIAKYCKETDCGRCQVRKSVLIGSEKYHWCGLQMVTPKDWNDLPIVETNLYDKRTVVKNATVEILENTKTGETSIGWWEND